MEIQVNDSNFNKEVLESEIPVLVDFWAAWCGPCKMIAPTIEELAREYQGRIKVCKVNVDQAPQTAADYGIMSIPTLSLFKGGKIMKQIVGVVPKSSLDKTLSAYI